VKDRIQGVVRLAMHCSPARTTPVAIKKMLTARGGAYTPPRQPGNLPGNELGYEAKPVPGRPGWIAVVPTLAIQCGTDSMVMIFTPRRQGWSEMISRRSAPYRSIDQGWMGLEYAVSPPDARGRWYLAIASTTPWCQSMWQGLRYDLSRPGPGGGAAHIFYSKRVDTYLGDETAKMHAASGSFEIRHDGPSIDGGILIRPHVDHYAIAGDRVRRIQPVALSLRDFVDEWIVSPWAEAASWSTGTGMKAAHARLGALDKQGSLDFGAIRRCAGGGHQVELEPDAPWYVRVGGTQPFTVRAVSRSPSPQCRG
jgi:hypothetical protein